MATESRFNINLDGLKAMTRELKTLPQVVPNVTSASINEAVDKMYTAAWKLIKPQYYVKQKYFSRDAKKVRANPTRLAGALVATGKRLTMSRFKYSPTRPFTKKARGGAKLRQPVSVKLGPNLPQAVPGSAFIATMPTGYTGVFKRVGAARYPIQQPLSDTGPAEMLANEKVRKALEIVGKEAFDKEFKRLTKVQLDLALGNLPK